MRLNATDITLFDGGVTVVDKEKTNFAGFGGGRHLMAVSSFEFK